MTPEALSVVRQREVVDERTAANVYVVGSGWGDGVYATYVGRTEDGRIAGFVTDFRVIPLG